MADQNSRSSTMRKWVDLSKIAGLHRAKRKASVLRPLLLVNLLLWALPAWSQRPLDCMGASRAALLLRAAEADPAQAPRFANPMIAGLSASAASSTPSRALISQLPTRIVSDGAVPERPPPGPRLSAP